jgi:osmoprotectant transport system permease protein
MKWAIENFSTVLQLSLQHIYLSVTPMIVGLLIAIPIGMLLYRGFRARRFAVVVCSIVFTIPSLALFVVIPAVIGTKILNPLNVIVALSMYSTALLIRSVLESLDSVPADVRDAAEAIGTSQLRRAVTVDLPLSIPVLTAGSRVVAVTNVSLVTVGAVIGIGGLGQLFTTGYQRSYPDEIFAGIIATLVLAFLFDRLLAGVGSVLTPWARAAGAR